MSGRNLARPSGCAATDLSATAAAPRPAPSAALSQPPWPRWSRRSCAPDAESAPGPGVAAGPLGGMAHATADQAHLGGADGRHRPAPQLAGRPAGLAARARPAGVVQHGSTPATRAAPLAGLAGNRAAVYLLTTPLPRSVDSSEPAGEPVPEAGEPTPEAAVEITEALPVEERWTPPKSRRGSVEPLHARAGEDEGSLQQRVLAARRLSAVQVAALVRVFLAAGWSVSDLVYALDHAPDGAAHWHTAPVHSPAGWLAARLGWWTDAAGAVRPSHTAQLTAAAAAHRRRLAGRAWPRIRPPPRRRPD